MGRGRFAVLVLLLAALVLHGCGKRGGYYEDDGPPRRPKVDVSKVPDAVPQQEALSKTGNNPYVALGQRYTPMGSAVGYRKRGVASWYGKKFHGRRTSSGETYDMYKMTAAHRTLPLPTYVKVTNLRNGKTVVVKVNDRGPFLHDRLIDLSYAAAARLGIVATGTGSVEVVSITPGQERGQESPVSTGVTAGNPVDEILVGDQRMYVQFGAFQFEAGALALLERLQENGIRFAHIQQSSDGYYRVRSGPFSSSVSAREMVLRGRGAGVEGNLISENAL